MSHKHTPCLGCDICAICVAEQSVQLVQALEDKHKAYRQGIEDAAKVAESPIINYAGKEPTFCYECDCHGEIPQEWYPKKIRALADTGKETP